MEAVGVDVERLAPAGILASDDITSHWTGP